MSHDEVDSWPGEVLTLLDSIDTVEALDVLCFVARDAAAVWSFDEIRQHVPVPDDVREAVVELRDRGLVTIDGQTVRLATCTPSEEATRLALLQLYDNDRSLVVLAMSDRSIGRLRASAARLLTRRTRDSGEK